MFVGRNSVEVYRCSHINVEFGMGRKQSGGGLDNQSDSDTNVEEEGSRSEGGGGEGGGRRRRRRKMISNKNLLR
jgi:hypothetical protein